ncbi:hypothetical protein CKY28_11385 [Sphingomonas lenta]|uniref:Uncharacterized protein n=1 Tax=Sphingomonas lenta TaxID=1141887 RepID=A0A2A2SG40_9SPHN|nr:hypothetical protein CKY28_11385 [Sphingomonas lenta]
MAASAALAGSAPAIAPAQGASPALIWRDIARLNILCLAQSSAGVDQAVQARLCERARGLAAQGAPVPVRAVALGDPAVLAPDAVTILIHASVEPGARLLALSVRPFRNSAEQTATLFAAAPRAVDLRGGDAATDRALAAALTETLPWRARPAGARPIR